MGSTGGSVKKRKKDEGKGREKNVKSWSWVHSETPIPSVTMLHCDYTVTTPWLDSDSVVIVTFVNCRQHGDYTAIGSLVTVLPSVHNSDYPVTVQWPCSRCA